MLDSEATIEAGAPRDTALREISVRRAFEEIRAAGMDRQGTIQSFGGKVGDPGNRFHPDRLRELMAERGVRSTKTCPAG